MSVSEKAGKMLKAVGAVCLLCSGLGIGNWKSGEYQRRVEELERMIFILHCLKGEISYAGNTLPEAFMRIGDKVSEPFRMFLQQTAKGLRAKSGKELYQILEETMKTAKIKGNPRKEDWKEFVKILSNLGYLDKEMQIHFLESGIEELERKRKRLEDQLPEQKRVWQSLGMLGGAFLVIILL